MTGRVLGQINQIYRWRINQINRAYLRSRNGLRNLLNQGQFRYLVCHIRKIVLSLARFLCVRNALLQPT